MSVGIYSASSLKHQSTWHVVPLGHINLNPSKSTFPFSPYNWVRCGEAAKTNLIIFEQMRARTHDLSHYNSNHVNIWQECISDCYLMPNEHYHLYHDMKKFYLDTRIRGWILSALHKTNTLYIICLVLAHGHYSLHISLYSNTLLWFWANQYLLILLGAVC
jgi:hypothetical protein